MLSAKTLSIAVSLLVAGLTAQADEMIKNQALVNQANQEMDAYIQRTVGDCTPAMQNIFRSQVHMTLSTYARLSDGKSRSLKVFEKQNARNQKAAAKLAKLNCKGRFDELFKAYNQIGKLANLITKLEKKHGVGNVVMADVYDWYKENRNVYIPVPMPHDSPAIGCLKWDVCELPPEPAVTPLPILNNQVEAAK